MIGYLEGKIRSISENKILLQTEMGMGYEVFFLHATEKMQKISLYISSVIRETEHTLYGFFQEQDKKMFELLLGVNGVGPKSAYSLVATLQAQGVYDAIIFEKKDLLKKAPGIGPKAAAQIILDLKNKISGLQKSYAPLPENAAKNQNSFLPENALMFESLDALKGLGFPEEQVIPKIQALLEQGSYQDSATLIKDVLKHGN